MSRRRTIIPKGAEVPLADGTVVRVHVYLPTLDCYSTNHGPWSRAIAEEAYLAAQADGAYSVPSSPDEEA